ncbi:MAG: hypothetical protein AAF456_13560 [Planctomycetota bacterium]
MDTNKLIEGRGRGFALATALLLCACFYLVQLPVPANGQQRQDRAQNQPQFRSGAQMSLDVLQEISTTLKSIDDRLANMERMAMQVQPPLPHGPGIAPGVAPHETPSRSNRR